MRVLARLAALILAAGFSGSYAQAADLHAVLDRMKSTVESRICRSDMAIYQHILYKQHCGEDYVHTMSSMDATQCQTEVDGFNRQIEAYNAWVRQCNRSGRSKLVTPSKEQAHLNKSSSQQEWELNHSGQRFYDPGTGGGVGSNFHPEDYERVAPPPPPSYTSDAALGYPAGCTNKMKYDRCALNGTPGTATCSLGGRVSAQSCKRAFRPEPIGF